MTTDDLKPQEKSIELVIYQIAQMDKSISSLAQTVDKNSEKTSASFSLLNEKVDNSLGKMNMRINQLELWKAGMKEVATQREMDKLADQIRSIRIPLGIIASAVILAIVGAAMKLLLIK